MSFSNILVTGSTGFIGTAVTAKILSLTSGSIIALVREDSPHRDVRLRKLVVDDFKCVTKKNITDQKCDILVHIAARAHVSRETVANPMAEFRKTNCEMTLHLARVAAAAGVKRFVFLSSIGVHGVISKKPFTISDDPAPSEDYSISKLEAEIGLKEIAQATGMEVVIIRPPLVYGINAPGNFRKLAKLADRNLPLPLGAINNRKSLVALDNLVDLIVTCIYHPNAANETFLVSDGHDLSTTELLTLMTLAAGKQPWLVPVPMSVINWGATVLGKKAVFDRLCGSLQVDITHTKDTLGWTPPVSVDEGIRRCFDGGGY